MRGERDQNVRTLKINSLAVVTLTFRSRSLYYRDWTKSRKEISVEPAQNEMIELFSRLISAGFVSEAQSGLQQILGLTVQAPGYLPQLKKTEIRRKWYKDVFTGRRPGSEITRLAPHTSQPILVFLSTLPSPQRIRGKKRKRGLRGRERSFRQHCLL